MTDFAHISRLCKSNVELYNVQTVLQDLAHYYDITPSERSAALRLIAQLREMRKQINAAISNA